MNTKYKVSNYEGYDYKAHFWADGNRNFEHLRETQTLHSLLKKFQPKSQTLLDAGCGFGRLFPSYEALAENVILMDYAENMISSAQNELEKTGKSAFLRGNLYELPLVSNSIETVVSIRTIHHLETPELFFREANRVLKSNGIFIVEIPNKAHLLNRIRYHLGNKKCNPYEFEPYIIGNTFTNYHPEDIKRRIEKVGLQVIQKQGLNFLRLPLLKKWVPLKLLLIADQFLQKTLSNSYLAPSIYLVCKKP